MNRKIVLLPLLAMLFFSFPTVIVKGTGNVWIETGSMNVERAYHTATLLSDGEVLVAGGMRAYTHIGTNSCELYRPSTGGWSATGSLHDIGFGHTATLLNDGKVLVVGGQQGVVSLCELYDPITGSWNLTGSLNIPRYYHTATLLPDGKVLVAGGDRGGGRVLECELYDPITEVWTFTGALSIGRTHAASALLPNGIVLITGGETQSGESTSTCELYDPSIGTWRFTGSMNTGRDWMENGCTLLQNGKFLVSGGGLGTGSATVSCELYDWTTEIWNTTGSLHFETWGHTATLLITGEVLLVGWGRSELYRPETGIWTYMGKTIYNRAVHAATLLANGNVLVSGGIVHEATTSCVLFIPAPPSPVASFTWTPFTTKVGEAVTFDASASTPNGGTIVKYEWNFGDGNKTTGEVVTHAYTNPGTCTVTLNVTDSEGLWDIEQKQIQVVQPHGPEAEFTWTPLSPRTGEAIEFAASASLPGWNGTHEIPIIEYRWGFGDGNKTTTSIPTVYHSFSSSGNYYVTLTVYALGATPETDSTTHKVSVIPVPVGGYSVPIKGYTAEKPLTLYLALTAILTTIFITIKRKTHKKKEGKLIFTNRLC